MKAIDVRTLACPACHGGLAFAGEVMRVGTRCYVQTPNRWFPVETHLFTPVVHWLPKPWQAGIVRRFTVWGAISGAEGERRSFFLEHYLHDLERSHVERALKQTGGVQVRAAELLGLSFRQFRYLVKKYGVRA